MTEITPGRSLVSTLLAAVLVVDPLAASGTRTTAVAADVMVSEPGGPLAAAPIPRRFDGMPLYFVANEGQLDARVAYSVLGSRTSVYFARDGVVVGQRGSAAGWAVRLDFEGANPNVRVVGREESAARVNYLRGRPSEWKTDVATFGSVVYEDLWPGIDLVYSGEGGKLKYTFELEPGADPSRIRLVYRGATGVRLTEAGRLAVETPTGGFEEDAPLSWQDGPRGRTVVESAFRVEAGAAAGHPGRDAGRPGEFRFGFRVGAHDPALPLVIDPVVLTYCGFLGGSLGGGTGDEAFGVAVDSTGAAYVVGRTQASDFPVTGGAFDTTYGGARDAFVAKVNAAGTGLVYATFIGGTGDEVARDVAVDGAGNAYVVGETSSTEATFPVLVGPDLTANGSIDAFVLKLNAAGTALVYNGFIGGTGSDRGTGIEIDAAGAAYVGGNANSDQFSFPVTAGAYDTAYNNQEAFVAKVSVTGAAPLTYCTYLGSGDTDTFTDIEVDGAGNAYVVGFTPNAIAPAFPTTAGAWDTVANGSDGFVTKLNTTGTALVYSTLLGGATTDSIAAIALDASNNAYVTGQTVSANFPRTSLQTYSAGNDAFVTKLNAAGSALVYSGYIGGTAFDAGSGIAVDAAGNAYVIGSTSSTESTGFPVGGGPDLTQNGLQDAFVVRVNAAGSALDYSGFIGGSGDEQGDAVAVDATGGAYFVGTTNSTEVTFPETVGPDLTQNGAGSNDAFIAKLQWTTTVYYSVGTQSTALYSGNASASNGTLTLAAAAAANVGVGDEIRQGSNRYYITWRTSPTVFSIQNSAANSGTPGATNITFASTAITIFRAFNLLSTAEANSSDASHLNTANLVTGAFQLNWACYKDANMDDTVVIDGYTTGANNYIRVFTPTLPNHVGASQRHTGTARTGFRLRPSVVSDRDTIRVLDNHVRVEGIEIDGSLYSGSFGYGGVSIETAAATPAAHYVQSNIIYSTRTYTGIYVSSTAAWVSNNVLHQVNNTNAALGALVMDQAAGTAYFYNNTVYDHAGYGIRRNAGTLFARNNVSMLPGGGFTDYSGTITQNNNASSDGTAGGAGSRTGLTGYATYFQSITAGSENLHLRGDSLAMFGGYGADLDADANLPMTEDVDDQVRDATQPDMGADEYAAATAVTLASFAARGYDSAVRVEWETGSELDNLGFHLYRGRSPDGPWQRLTSALVPGLGSSPEGRGYAWADRGLVNGETYYYRLEDVERSGRATAHGPVSATPVAGEALVEAGEGSAAGSAEEPAPAAVGPWTAHGDPADVSLRVLSRNARGATLELRTGGFYSQPRADGTHRLHVPGFFEATEAGLPAVPVKRAWIDAVVGRGARVVATQARDQRSFAGIEPVLAGAAQAEAGRDGTYRVSARRVRGRRLAGLYPVAVARVLETAFQDEAKRAYLELAPLRFDGPRRRLVLATRLVVKVAFDGRVAGETGAGGSRGRRRPQAPPALPETILARVATRAAGLHAVGFESLSAADALRARGTQGIAVSSLRLSRRGAPVAFRVEPRADRFGPGSTLYFLADGPETAYSGEPVYELAIAAGGVAMAVAGPAPRSAAGASVATLVATRTFEQNTNYLPALLAARDRWFWDIGLLAPSGRDYAFTLPAPAPGEARIAVELQGGSDAPGVDPDHRVSLLVNGVPVGEAVWDGLEPTRFEAPIDASVLREGANTLRVENLDTTGAGGSVAYLDRFSLSFPRVPAAQAGVLDGRAAASGRVRAAGFPAGAFVVDVTGPVPAWLPSTAAAGEVSFVAEAGRSYVATAPDAVLRPEVRLAAAPRLRSASLQADWIVIAPQALLPAAEPLVAERESQGLSALAVSLEQAQDEFGHGERSPEMLRAFLAHAYHAWSRPSPRYVLLLGDASSDPKGYLPAAARKDLLPTPLVRSTYLWTASDPLLAAVNGDDAIPDLAIGRLSAGSLAEAEAAVAKILAFEESRQGLDGNAVLVADNPDLAGDFEANLNDVASLLGGRPLERIFLRERGAATRAAVLSAFDAGASLVSYVGHGSQSLWASESILRSIDAPLLQPQPRQPLVLTMTCSNGYFVSPTLNSLAERFVLEPGRGAIAAFSPAGLSVDAAAHLYHRAIVQELARGTHERLGDLVLAAQRDYAETGALPELLSIYHLFGDPALRVR